MRRLMMAAVAAVVAMSAQVHAGCAVGFGLYHATATVSVSGAVHADISAVSADVVSEIRDEFSLTATVSEFVTEQGSLPDLRLRGTQRGPSVTCEGSFSDTNWSWAISGYVGLGPITGRLDGNFYLSEVDAVNLTLAAEISATAALQFSLERDIGNGWSVGAAVGVRAVCAEMSATVRTSIESLSYTIDGCALTHSVGGTITKRTDWGLVSAGVAVATFPSLYESGQFVTGSLSVETVTTKVSASMRLLFAKPVGGASEVPYTPGAAADVYSIRW